VGRGHMLQADMVLQKRCSSLIIPGLPSVSSILRLPVHSITYFWRTKVTPRDASSMRVTHGRGSRFTGVLAFAVVYFYHRSNVRQLDVLKLIGKLIFRHED